MNELMSFCCRLGDVTLKIIDTPGIADCRGVDADLLNLKYLLKFLSNYKELNAICVLLKPNNAKIGIVFKYSILELLTHLNKSASDNILFLFTNSRGTFYKPGDTAKALRTVLRTFNQNRHTSKSNSRWRTTFASTVKRSAIWLLSPNGTTSHSTMLPMPISRRVGNGL